MKSLIFVASVVCIVRILGPFAHGQDAGNPLNPADAQFYDNFGVDSVNLQNLSVDISVPILSKKGAIPFSYTLEGTSSCVSLKGSNNYYYTECGIGPSKSYSEVYENWGLLGVSPVNNENTGTWILEYENETNSSCGGGTRTTYSELYISSPDGTTYPLPAGDTYATGPSGCTQYLNDYTVIGGLHVQQSSGQSSQYPTITAPNGIVLSTTGGGSNASEDDLFGNSISFTYSTNVYTDTLGVKTLTVTPYNANESGSAGAYTYSDTNGTPHTFQEQTSAATISTNFGCSTSRDTTNSGVVLSAIDYPDGTNLQFAYEPSNTGTTGRVQQITLRTGGTITYSYGSMNCSMIGAALIPSSLARTTSDGTTTYSYSAISGGSTTTVLDPGQNKVVYTFMGPNPGQIQTSVPTTLAEVQRWQNTGTVQSPVYSLLSTDIYCYNGNTSNCPSTQAAYPLTQRDSYHYTGTTSLAMNHETETFDTYGNIISSATYDYISGQTITTSTVYGSWNGTACVAVGDNIVNKPCDVSTSDGTHTLSHVRQTYNSQGFNTQTTKWTGSTWLTSAATPNTNGTVATSTDINGQSTSYSYAITGSGGCDSILLTATSTNVSGVDLTTGESWDCNGAVVLSKTDSNGNTAHYAYDELFRTASASDMAGFTTSNAYTANTVTTTNTYLANVVTLDGLGLPILSQTADGSQYDTTSTSYSWVGPNATIGVSYPCKSALGSGCPINNTITIDPLGRTMVASDTNGYTGTNTYTENDVTTTISPAPNGEHVKTSQAEVDGLGRMKSGCKIETSGGSACGEVAGGSGIIDSYSYSFSAGASTVSVARGVQTHTTVRDALGRVTSTTTPEAGTVTYIYDSADAPNCGAVSSPGDLLEVTYNSGAYNCYLRDPLHRLIGVGGSQVPCKRFAYDTSGGYYNQSPPSGYTGNNLLGQVAEAETDDCTWPPSSAHTITDEWLSYDPDGRITDVWEMTPHSGGYYHTAVTYYANGALETLSGIPGYPSYSYAVDTQGREYSLAQSGVLQVSAVKYDAAEHITEIDYNSTSGESDKYTYDSVNGLMKTYAFTIGSTTDAGTLTWNANRTLQSIDIVDSLSGSLDSGTCTFTYDDVVRISADNCGSSLWSQTYSYDQYDNLTTTGNPGGTFNPGYNSTNNRYSSIGATYDADGHLTYDSFNSYTWDVYGKMATVIAEKATPSCGTSGTCITYDAYGRAVEKNASGTVTEFLYSPTGETSVMSGMTSTNSYIPAPGGGYVWTNNPSGNNRTVQHRDWLGTVRLETNLNMDTIKSNRAYSAYGETFAVDGSDMMNFTGDKQDLFVGLFDTPNRELAQNQSRWLSPDPAGARWNAYAYPTNPGGQTDPTGLRPCVPFVCNSAAQSFSVEGDFSATELEFAWNAGTENDEVSAGMPVGPGDLHEDLCMGCNDFMTDNEIGEAISYIQLWGPNGGLLGPSAGSTALPTDQMAQFSRSYSQIPFVSGSGIYGVGNWMRDNIVESFEWLHDEMDKCEMCGPSLTTVIKTFWNGQTPTLYRGGRSFEPKPYDFRLNPDGTVKTGWGLSVNTDPNAVRQFGGAYEIKRLPPGLTAIQRGKNPNHWEIVAQEEGLTMEEITEMLSRIEAVPIE